MAETTVIGAENGAPPPPNEVKRPPGRPRKDGQPAGSGAPPETTPPEDFFLMLPSITDEEWQVRVVYLYRMYPITDRRNTGNPVYLTKLSEPFDRDRVMRDFGSGIYKAELLLVLPNQRGKRLTASIFQILNQDYPPKVPAGEWVNDPRNADWEWCRQKLGPNGTPAQQSADDIANAVTKVYREMHPDAGSKEQTSIVAAIMEMVQKNQALMMTMMDPAKQLEQIKFLVSLMPKPEPPAENKTDHMFMEFLMRRLEQLETRKETGLLESIIGDPEKREVLRMMFKGGGGSSGPHLDGWAALLDKAIDKLGPGIGSALGTVSTIIAQRAMMQQQSPRPTVVNTTAQPLPAPESSPQPSANSPTQGPQMDQNQMALLQKYGQAIQQALPFMIDQFKEDEPDGYGCRDWFISPKRFGNVIWDGMRNEIGVEQFVQIAKSLPQVWASFQPEEKFRVFLTEFFTPIGAEEPHYYDEEEQNGKENTNAA